MTQTKAYDVAVFGAHPDDSEMGMGGTLIRCVEAGMRVINISLTPSQMSTYGDVESRKEEFEAAAKIMGCDCRMLNFMDSDVINDRESRLEIVKLIRELRPRIIFAPYHTNNLAEPAGIANVDHYTTGALVRDAVKFSRLKRILPEYEPHTVRKMFFYMVPRNVWANIIVDVSDSIEKLKEVLQAYKSQLSIEFGGNQIEDILLRYRAGNAARAGMKYAEVFTTDQSLLMEPEDFLRL